MGAQISLLFSQCLPLSSLSDSVNSTPNSAAAASSTSPLPFNCKGEKYEVFISFRGFDVRHGFLSHLIRALKFNLIHAFIDNDLLRGKDISASLSQIIEESDLSIVIFSQNYPKSVWCLEELEKISESMKQSKHRVVPVFYQVDPSDVQDLKGNYAIQNHKWRDSLVEISNLSGFHSKNHSTDAELVDSIVDEVSLVLNETCPFISHKEGLYGTETSIKDVEALLRFDSIDHVRMVGIWGMGGIGKTTIANEVFDSNRKRFCGHCFVSNVREKLSTSDGLMSLRDKIIRDLLGDKDIRIDSSDSVDHSICRRLKRAKVLLVLDDVLTSMQLKSLLKASGLHSPDSFCPGSRIIVTSRNSQVLRDVIFRSYIYEAQHLKYIEALQLFSWHAFGQHNPCQGYEKLSQKAVRYAQGVPLALIVLGCELKYKTRSQWEVALNKFNFITPFGIQKILRISFDGLDRDEKNIFLDIACFLKGNKRDYVVNVLEAFGFHAKFGIDRLIDKSLLKAEGKDEDGEGVTITMHDLLEQMGKEIVVEEKESKGHGSRLWTYDHIKDALTNYRGTENVEAISLQHCNGDQIDINPEPFMHMCKLRFLKFKLHSFYKVNCPMGLEFLPNSIKYFHWDYYPLHYFPFSFNSEKLVELQLRCSEVKEIDWRQPLVSLKLICLHRSKNLIKISDLAMARNLEDIDLSYCDSLVEVRSSLLKLNKLKKLNLDGCSSLSHLPELPYCLEEMKLRYSGLRQLSSTVGRLTHLKLLSLSYCSKFEILPSTISSLISLEVLDLSGCSRLVEIGSSLQNLKKLARLDVSDCTSLSLLPELPISIVELNLSRSGLKQLPSIVGHLMHSKELSFFSCGKLESLPRSMCNLTSLETLNLSFCRSLQKLPQDFGNLKSLKELKASYSGLRELPRSIRNLNKLVRLDLTGCHELKSLPALPSNLKLLGARRFLSPAKVQKFCSDGMQVPKWMMYRSNCGTSISIELETFGRPIHFIFCVVISSNFPPHYVSSIESVATLTAENSETYKSFAYPAGGQKILQCLRKRTFLLQWNCNFDCEFLKEVSFGLVNDSKVGKIIKCGVHPIFVEKISSKRTKPEDEEHLYVDDDLSSLFIE